MIKVALSENKSTGFRWFSNETVFVKGYLFADEGQLHEGEGLLGYFQRITGYDDFLSRLARATGLFSVVVLHGSEVFAATDAVRAFPLFYCEKEGVFYISDTPALLAGNDKPLSLNSRAALQFEAIAYVLGRDTLLNGVYQVQAQEALRFGGEGVSRQFYKEIGGTVSTRSKKQLKADFRQMIARLTERLVKQLAGRPVLLPLSGGNDSRLLALMLKEANYENVLCFTYGAPDTPEKENAQKSAKALGFKWLFIDCSEYAGQDVMASEAFREWMGFASNFSSLSYFQEYLAAYYLKTKSLIPDNAVFIPGHSADGVAGNFLISGMNKMTDVRDFARYALMKNASLRILNKAERTMLTNDIVDAMCSYRCDEKRRYLLYETWQVKERQSKQIVNSSKIWDFFGHQYLLPFWDEMFTSFFFALPYPFKISKSFYVETVWEMFSEKGILFENESHISPFAEKKQRIKLWLMKFPLFALFLQRRNLWQDDFSCIRLFSDRICLDLKRAGKLKKIRHRNGLLSAWYLLYIDKKVD